jgi:2-amino-4-hydroxy-6-hydroxymethyldihydropteridine diphosphokinase
MLPMSRAFLGLGSNLGDRAANLRTAIVDLEAAGATVRAASSVWETEPVDAPGQDWFLNMVVEVEVDETPLALLDILLAIERRAGRKRAERNAPRTLDLDLLVFEDLRVMGPRLCLPHPRMWQRRFVLAPLAEIAPDLRDPRTGRTVHDELQRLADTPAVRRIGVLASDAGAPL